MAVLLKKIENFISFIKLNFFVFVQELAYSSPEIKANEAILLNVLGNVHDAFNKRHVSKKWRLPCQIPTLFDIAIWWEQ